MHSGIDISINEKTTGLCVLEKENFLELPLFVREPWGLSEGDDVYVAMATGRMLIHRVRPAKGYVIAKRLYDGRGLTLPPHFLEKMRIQIGQKMVLTLVDDVVILCGKRICPGEGNVIRFEDIGTGSSKGILINRLQAEKTELEQIALNLDNPNLQRLLGRLIFFFADDIINCIELDFCPDSAIRVLLKEENPLMTMLYKANLNMRNTEAYDNLFEQSLRQLLDGLGNE